MNLKDRLSRKKGQIFLNLGVFLLLCFAAIYFRTYSLRPFTPGENTIREFAEKKILEKIAGQVTGMLEQNYPQLPAEERKILALAQAKQMAASEKDQFEQAVQGALKQYELLNQKKSSRLYLLEADPYYYFRLTRSIAETGRPVPVIKNGKYYDPLAHAPKGNEAPANWHPYLGFFWYYLQSLFRPGLDLVESAASFPLVLCVVVIFLFLGLARALEISIFPAVIGCLALTLSPIFIQRNAFGWYDTDPYNYIFPILILISFLKGIEAKGNRPILWGAIGGFLAGLYSFFWTGWAFILFIIPGALFPAAGITWIIFKAQKPEILKSSLSYGISYFIFSLIFAVICVTPVGFMDSVKTSWNVLNQFLQSGFDLWPNSFMTVGEAKAISLKKLIYLTGTYGTAFLGFAGVVLEGIRARVSRNPKILLQWLFLIFFTLPLFVLSLKTERFSVLLVLPLALFSMIGIQAGKMLLPPFLEKRVAENHRKWIPAGFTTVVFFIFFPLSLLSAHVVALGIKPIMNDGWYDALSEVEQKTPADSIINSWWPPGHFITAIGRRRVVLDGGTQHERDVYWISRILCTADEWQAAGLLRMINTSSTEAFDYLESTGMSTPEAVDLLLRMAPLNREQAFKLLPERLDSQAKEHLLDLTHHQNIPPTYVFLYNDLIEQNLAMTVLDQWNFKKAGEISEKRRESGGLMNKLLKRGPARPTSYLQDFLSVAGPLLKYTPEAQLVKKEGSKLSFSNGLVVDLSSKEASVLMPGTNAQGRPKSFFYMENGQLVEKQLEGQKIDVSALLIEDQGDYRSVLADARLIRSMLFRLYYLKGEGLTAFKPFASKKDVPSESAFFVYEMDRQALNEHNSLTNEEIP